MSFDKRSRHTQAVLNQWTSHPIHR